MRGCESILDDCFFFDVMLRDKREGFFSAVVIELASERRLLGQI